MFRDKGLDTSNSFPNGSEKNAYLNTYIQSAKAKGVKCKRLLDDMGYMKDCSNFAASL